MAEKLIPPDYKRCQTESRSFMTLGPGLVRCGKAPNWIVTEPKRADRKKRGSMSLCDEHMQVCARRMPDAVFKPIPAKRRIAAAPREPK